MDNQATINYYLQLLICQYRILPKAQATMNILINRALCDGLPQTLERAFDLNTAIGLQLDILGNIVGVPRYVYGLDLTHTYFSFIRYNDTTPRPGFGRYNENPYPSSIWLRYIASGSTQMTDFEMLACIQIKIIQNNMYTSLKDVSDALWAVFGNNIRVVDHANMSITYDATSQYFPILEIAQYLEILPKPMGVSLAIGYP